MKQFKAVFCHFLLAGLLFSSPLLVRADAPAEDGTLLNFKSPSLLTEHVNLEQAKATVATEGETPVVQAEYPAGNGYPAVKFHGPWDLTGYTGVQVTVKNTGASNARVVLRVDGGDNWKESPWNTQTVSILPGDTQVIRVVFGESDGKPGYALVPSGVLRALVFVINPTDVVKLSMSELKACK